MNLIIGMHRSGTSLAARLLHQAGGDFGDPVGFYPANRWNPDGYFEQREILALNRELLHGAWGKLAYFFLPSAASVRRRGKKLGTKLADVGVRYRGRIVKDPRFCVTAPAWLDHGVEFGKILICLREPQEVARSLGQRNKIPHALALRLWEEHFRLNLEFVRDRPHRWLSYAHLLDPKTCVSEFAGAARFLGLPVDEEKDAPWIRKIIRTRPSDFLPAPVRYADSLAALWSEVQDRHARQQEA